jgi:hypothetical protein
MNKTLDELIFDNDIIAIHGEIGSGKTLPAIAILNLVKAKNIVSNCVLRDMEYTKFNMSDIFDYKDSVIFWDMVDTVTEDRRIYGKYHDNIRGFLGSLHENNNHLMVTLVQAEYLEPDIKKLVDVWILTNYNSYHDDVRLFIMSHGEEEWAILGNVSQWFKKYSTVEIPIRISEVIK